MSRPSRDEVVRLDKRRIWHPYTPMDRYMTEVDPLVITRAEGARLFDVDGRSYIDANSSWWVASLGQATRASSRRSRAQARRSATSRSRA